MNSDPSELQKFSEIAHRWWDTNSEFRPLHDINPLRLQWIERHARLTAKRVLDVGCGGGILAESLAQAGANVTGIDLSEQALKVAELHSLDSGVPVRYELIAAEDLAQREPEQYDIVTCMEMLEHVPDPGSVVRACARLTKPGGLIFFSTLNRNAKSFLFAIVGAEYLLHLLPKGTHDFTKFVTPAELSQFARAAGLSIDAITGLNYQPLTGTYSLVDDVSVNYLLACGKPFQPMPI
ncbi:MAG: bifunctional 2-polyprenyl-6-hydroxyphenol methylase/3-demethylubiquinol 3-O-methyltransferase UbiG [Burkholderiaceae bacterium]|nr:bifunctional 2-polyprenyl-6-hydroxyphenol methylase/3-demethylubiquinol 3-O-methyltransferase UbiG [Burkholderiaceae bacterium]